MCLFCCQFIWNYLVFSGRRREVITAMREISQAFQAFGGSGQRVGIEGVLMPKPSELNGVRQISYI